VIGRVLLLIRVTFDGWRTIFKKCFLLYCICTLIETQPITLLIYIGKNLFKRCPHSNCQWSTMLPETKHCVIRICSKSSLAHPKIGRIKTLPPDDTHFCVSFNENPKHFHKREQKTPLTIKEAQKMKIAHNKAAKNSTLLSTA
jgi:hypothetical protein